jgi:hypothetical protein
MFCYALIVIEEISDAPRLGRPRDRAESGPRLPIGFDIFQEEGVEASNRRGRVMCRHLTCVVDESFRPFDNRTPSLRLS